MRQGEGIGDERLEEDFEEGFERQDTAKIITSMFPSSRHYTVPGRSHQKPEEEDSAVVPYTSKVSIASKDHMQVQPNDALSLS